MLKNYLYIFIISMVPIVELRGAVPIGVGLGLPLLPALLTCIVGNMVPVPFIILFFRKILTWLSTKSKWLAGKVEWLENRTAKKAEIIYKYELLGLLILVAIPLPGTGAWTGAMVAALLNIRMKNAVPIILAGVTIAGIIMCVISYGVSALVG